MTQEEEDELDRRRREADEAELRRQEADAPRPPTGTQASIADLTAARTEVTRGGGRNRGGGLGTPAGGVEGLANGLNGLLTRSERRSRRPQEEGSGYKK